MIVYDRDNCMPDRKQGKSTKKSNRPGNDASSVMNEKILALAEEKIKLKDKIARQKQQVEAYQAESGRIGKLRNLIEINSFISHSLEKEEVLQRILDQIKMLLNCELSSILLVDEEMQCLKFAFMSKTEDAEQLKSTQLKMGEGIAGTVWDNGTPIIINDAQSDSRFSKLGDSKTNITTRSLVAVPLTVNGQITGVIEAINKRAGIFDDFDLQLLQYVSTQSAIAIKNANLYDMAIRDGMTKLFMHKYFNKRLEEEWKRTRRYEKNLSLIILDIDHFKGFNDTYGHQAGDRVLKEVARVIQNNCRAIDIPCRYGGEEFAVILPETSSGDAMVFAERIRAMIERMRIHYNDAVLQLTISGGVASFPEVQPPDIEGFIELADLALYYSKNNGRNRLTLYDQGLAGR